MSHVSRRLPVGAEVQPEGGTHFRVWAPKPREVVLRVSARNGGWRDVALERESQGYYSALVPDAHAGDRYRYRLDGDEVADPASRFQPEGPVGPSQIVDPGRFQWTDAALGRRRAARPGAVRDARRHLHRGGNVAQRDRELPTRRRLGITSIELMPVAEFPGRFGWGYDGVFPYAPTRLYGTPDELRAFVDRAHALGLGVILDVVYNHLGPDGCVFSRFATSYFTSKYENEWGEALNFDGPDSAPVREYFACNAAYWIDEFHFDGLRLDATQSIHDSSSEHIIAALGDERARRRRRAGRSSSSPRTSRRTCACCGRSRRAATASMPRGTTTSITARSVALTGRRRGVLRRSPRGAAGVRVGGEVRLSVPGTTVRAGRSRIAGTDARAIAPARLRQLHREPRSGGELGRRLAHARCARRPAGIAR